MTYAHLDIESSKSNTQKLSTGQRLWNTCLQYKLAQLLGFSFKHQSLSAFSEELSLKRKKLDSTETITMKSPKKITAF